MKKVIEVKNLYKLYRVGDEIVRALDGVNFEIYEGEFCAIVGTSGSGKSTLLNMLAGLEKPTKGEVSIAGTHIPAGSCGIHLSVISSDGNTECGGKCSIAIKFP